LDGEPSHSPLRNAFQKFELDPIDPFNWRLLLARFASIFLSPAQMRPRGARPKWNEPERKLFQARIAEARQALRQDGMRPTTKRVADELRCYYPHLDAASIRKYIASGPPKGRERPNEK
jgi:hypothetical protein